MDKRPPGIFLSAQWHHLLMVNYAIDPAILAPLVPRGTVLDTWNGTTYVSLVGFRFLDTRVKGWRIPFHTNFEEINLRFYVLRKESGEWRRGVVFIKEIVPRAAITLMARWAYNESYVTLPTRHRLLESPELGVRYEWRLRGRWNVLGARAPGKARPLREGEEAQFISEHYWGYTGQRDGGTKEYRVEHPAWNVWDAKDPVVDVDVEALYGSPFVEALRQTPTSVFIADGSEVSVRGGRRIMG